MQRQPRLLPRQRVGEAAGDQLDRVVVGEQAGEPGVGDPLQQLRVAAVEAGAGLVAPASGRASSSSRAARRRSRCRGTPCRLSRPPPCLSPGRASGRRSRRPFAASESGGAGRSARRGPARRARRGSGCRAPSPRCPRSGPRPRISSRQREPCPRRRESRCRTRAPACRRRRRRSGCRRARTNPTASSTAASSAPGRRRPRRSCSRCPRPAGGRRSACPSREVAARRGGRAARVEHVAAGIVERQRQQKVMPSFTSATPCSTFSRVTSSCGRAGRRGRTRPSWSPAGLVFPSASVVVPPEPFGDERRLVPAFDARRRCSR